MTGSDTLVFVVDVLGGYRRRPQRTASPQSAGDPKLPSVSPSLAGVAPPVTIPKAVPPGTLQAETLVQGTGPPVAKGKLLVAQYEGLIWRTGKVFDSSWQRGVPASFVIGTGKVIPGWDKTLVGQRIGSRGAAGDPAQGRPRRAPRRPGSRAQTRWSSSSTSSPPTEPVARRPVRKGPVQRHCLHIATTQLVSAY